MQSPRQAARCCNLQLQFQHISWPLWGSLNLTSPGSLMSSATDFIDHQRDVSDDTFLNTLGARPKWRHNLVFAGWLGLARFCRHEILPLQIARRRLNPNMFYLYNWNRAVAGDTGV